MLKELNEIIEGVTIDIASEGMGTAVGMALMWSLFFGGTFTVFYWIMTLLASTI